MQALQLDEIQLEEVADPGDEQARFRFAFPMHAGTGSADSAVVYMELDPGMHLGMHTDSQEEVVVVLEGTAEATVAGERGTLGAGGVVVIPAMAPHDLRNVGDGPMRAVGFFSGGVVYSTFAGTPVAGASGVLSVNGAGAGEQVFALLPLQE
jgi:quercetin dioxygenase-like cupin family protein